MNNVKDVLFMKTNDIKQLCDDLKYAENKDLKIFGIQRIKELTEGIEVYLVNFDIVEREEER